MAQCEKTLETGERCSNPAVPGSRYCDKHGRITFKPVKRPADTAPPLPTPPVPAKAKAAPGKAKPAPEGAAPAWKAVPSPAGQAPGFPGLRPDERNILVAPRGLIWLPAAAANHSATQFHRLVRLLGFLSQAIELPGQVEVSRREETGDILVSLQPAQGDTARLSLFYDAASSAARLVDGGLYLGQGRAFVQYRDDGAPRGYDVADFKPREEDKRLTLIAHWGCQSVATSLFTEMSLAEFCLQVAPVAEAAGTPPSQVYALTPGSLYGLLSKYLRAHRLGYELAHLRASHGGELVLFGISPRADAPTGQRVPAFVLDCLSRLPRVVVMTEAHRDGDRRVLLQWKHRYPLRLAHVAGAFAPNDLVLLSADHYPNLLVNPVPAFFNGDDAVVLTDEKRAPMKLTPRPFDGVAAVPLPLSLRPAHGPTPPTGALMLDAEETGWLRQLLYRLPGDAFAAYLLCLGEEGAVLVGNGRAIEGIPFGVPLRRLAETELFLPLRSALVPDLPWPILRTALKIQDQVYTFFTDDGRLDLPVKDFAPLTRSLMADPAQARVTFNPKAAKTMPELRWTSPPAPPPRPASEPSQRPAGGRPEQALPTPPQSGAQVDVKALWREQARVCEEAKDFLAAAICYSSLEDRSNSARCYRLAASPPAAKE